MEIPNISVSILADSLVPWLPLMFTVLRGFNIEGAVYACGSSVLEIRGGIVKQILWEP